MSESAGWKTTILGICVVIVSAAMFADAQEAHRGSRSWRPTERQAGQQQWWHNEAAVAKLALSTEQVQKLDGISISYQEKETKSRSEYTEAFQKFIDLLEDSEATPEAIQSSRQAVEDARAQMTSNSVDQLLEIRSTLSSEQFKMLREVAPSVLRLGQGSSRGARSSSRSR